MAKQKTLYSSDSIVNETPREFTRRVPSTYLGSSITNENLIKEIYANAVDEAKLGHGDFIRVIIDTMKNVYIVEDFGQGFLINEPGIDKKTGKKIDDGETILQRSFDKINTSGKTSVDGVYGGSSLGLNGIGAKLTNWLSRTLHVVTYRDGRYEELWFKDGIFVKRKVGKSDRASGTVVTWSPDAQFFKQNIPNMFVIEALLDHTTTFCPNLTVELEYNGNKKIFHEPDGLNGYIARRVGEKEIFDQRFITDRSMMVNDYSYEYDGHTIHLLDGDFNSKGICEREFTLYTDTDHGQTQYKETLTISKSDCLSKAREEQINIGITFTKDHSETIDSYVNLGHTESGAHITAFHGAIARAINKYAVEAGLLKKNDKSLSSSEVCDGLYAVFNITTTTAKYDAQNKSRIDDIDTTIINSVLGGDFATWLLNNKVDAKKIVENALQHRKEEEEVKKIREKMRDVKRGKGTKALFTDLPTKLSDAYPKDKKDRSKCELMICEGDSAVGSINAVKDSSFQASFPIRGKILNCKYAQASKILGNGEVMAIIKSLGLSMEEGNSVRLIFDEKKIRYSKIIITTDADADGSDIAMLLITVFHRICPELIYNGYIYRVYGALYKVTFPNGEYILFQNDAELNKWRAKNKNKKYTVARAKGLGEMSEDDTYDQLVNPATRNLKRLVVKNPQEFEEWLELVKGNDSYARKEYLYHGSVEYDASSEE